jgi:hypothetical protein
MHDDELITMVQEQRTKVPMTTPVEEIVSRGRSVRARRRIPGLAGALAVAAGAAVAVAALVPSGHQAPRPATARLAAWTVTRQADGDVQVTIRELRDRTGLQAALHADGVPSYIAFAGPAPAYCQVAPASQAQLQAIYQFHPGSKDAVLVIDPSNIPSGDGLFIFDIPASPAGVKPPSPVIAGRSVQIGLVQGSQRCPLGTASS